MSITEELLEKRMTMKVLFRFDVSVHQEGTPPQVLITQFNGDYSAWFDIGSN